MHTGSIAALAFALAMAGCASGGGAGTDGGPTGGDGGGDGDGMTDLGDGTWSLENVSNTPDTMGFYAQQVFAGERRLVAWAETDAVNLSDSDVVVAEHATGSWTSVPLTDSDLQDTYPALAASGSAAYLTWAGRPDAAADYDIYLSLLAGSSWSTPMNVTGSFEGVELRRDYRPSAATGPGGELAIAYLSEAIGGDRDGLADVRVIRLSSGVLDDPVTAVSVPDRSCTDADVAIDEMGRTHVVAACGGALQYASNDGGGWSSRVIELEETGIVSPSLAADAGLHLVFRADVPACEDTGCDDIYYAPGALGDFGPVVNVSKDAAAMDVLPTVAARGGRVFVAYRKNGGPDPDDAYLSWSDDGFSFADPIELAPDPDDVSNQPTHIAFQPGTGAPTVTLLRTFRGTDPLNIDVFVADFAPPPPR